MVHGKPITWFAQQMDLSPPLDILVFVAHTHQRVGVHSAQRTGVRLCSRATDVRPAYWMCIQSCSRLWWPWSITWNMMGTVVRKVKFLDMWVRIPCKVMKLDSESSVSRGDWDCLLLLPHRVRTVTIVEIILMDANLYLACLVWLIKLESES
jgi:hypothetical protein